MGTRQQGRRCACGDTVERSIVPTGTTVARGFLAEPGVGKRSGSDDGHHGRRSWTGRLLAHEARNDGTDICSAAILELTLGKSQGFQSTVVFCCVAAPHENALPATPAACRSGRQGGSGSRCGVEPPRRVRQQAAAYCVNNPACCVLSVRQRMGACARLASHSLTCRKWPQPRKGTGGRRAASGEG